MIATVSTALALTACTGDSYDREIALEAHWQCDVQHRTYADLSDMEGDLSERLTSEGISADRYAQFKNDLEGSSVLRTEVLGAYDAYCGTTSDD